MKEKFFYSPIFGDAILIEINNYSKDFSIRTSLADFKFDGRCSINGECVIFPSRDQKDWNKWAEEQKPKVPKTWSELIQKNRPCGNVTLGYRKKEDNSVGDDSWTCNNTPIEKSALALLKIHQLIEVGYGGNVIEDVYSAWTIDPHSFNPVINKFGYRHLLFHSKEQAEEFLSYPENVQLIKDFYMI